MEWKRVKTYMILLLLVVNLILAAGIYSRTRENNNSEKQGVLAAAQILSEKQISVDSQVFLKLPKTSKVYVFSRDTQTEEKIASMMLGEYQKTQPGGGVESYVSDSGTLNFRSGGFFDLTLKLKQEKMGKTDSDTLYSLLSKSGVNMRDAVVYAEEDEVIFTMGWEGRRAQNSRIVGKIKDGVVSLSGRWIFSKEWSEESCKVSRGEMILAIGQVIKAPAAITQISAMYYLDSSKTGDIQLVPVWQIYTDSGEYLFHGVTKKLIIQ